jgi:hypothetical protein
MKKILLALFLAQVPNPASSGSVQGKVLNIDGAPAVGVRVAAVPVPDGSAAAAAPVLSSIAQTDSQGNYTLLNIKPGPYYVMAGLVDRPTYYPGVTSPGPASLIRVTASRTAAVDFKLTEALGLRVSGRVTGLTALLPRVPGMPFATVTLLPRTRQITILNAEVKSDFTFEFASVPPGSYFVEIPGLGTYALKDEVVLNVKDMNVADVVLSMADTALVTRKEGLEEVWSLPGRWSGVASDPKSGTIYASGSGRLTQIGADGKTKFDTPFTNSQFIRVAHFAGKDEPVFLSFGTWSSGVQAFDSKGQLVWTYPPADSPGQGIDDVWPIDLDGDRSDEVIVGFNGSTGLHVLNSKGQVLWKVTGSIGNVWHVSGGDVRGDGKPLVVTTSAAGKIHIFSDEGAKRTDLDAGVYAMMIRVGKIADTDKSDTLIVGATDTTSSKGFLVALTGDGVKKWTMELPKSVRPAIQSVYLAPGKPWLAVGMQGGAVAVVDAVLGVTIAIIDGQGQIFEEAWLPVKDGSPLLVISSSTGLRSFRVTGTASNPVR